VAGLGGVPRPSGIIDVVTLNEAVVAIINGDAPLVGVRGQVVDISAEADKALVIDHIAHEGELVAVGLRSARTKQIVEIHGEPIVLVGAEVGDGPGAAERGVVNGIDSSATKLAPAGVPRVHVRVV